MTRLLLIRHGQSTANIAGVFAGHLDYPLTELGRQQVELTAEYIASQYTVDKVYASDLSRARETGEIAARKLGAGLEVHPGLREIFAGQWQGIKFDELKKRYEESYGIWLTDIGHSCCDGGETMGQMYDRILTTMKEIVCTNPEKTLVLATHATPIRVMQCVCEKKSLDDMKRIPWVTNASVSEMVYEAGEFHLVTVSVDRHLGNLSSCFPANV